MTPATSVSAPITMPAIASPPPAWAVRLVWVSATIPSTIPAIASGKPRQKKMVGTARTDVTSAPIAMPLVPDGAACR